MSVPSYCLLNHFTGATSNALFITGPKYIRLTITSGIVTASESYSDASQVDLKAAAVHVIDQNNLVVLMFGTLSTVITDQIVLATVNFAALTISYK